MIYLFMFVYAPPIIPAINVVIPLAFFSFGILILKYQKNVKQVINTSVMRSVALTVLLILIYLSIIIIVNLFTDQVNVSNYILTYYRLFLICPITFICILYIIVFCKKNDFSFVELLEKIVQAGIIQSVIAITMYLIPAFRALIISIMLNNTGNELLQNEWYLQRRCYAFSNTIVDSFGYGSGLICAVALYLALYHQKKYFFYLPFLIIVPLLNSRTGLIIFAISIIIFYLDIILSLKLQLMLKAVLYTILFIALFSIIMSILQNQSDLVYAWVKNGLDEMKDLIFGTATTTAGSVDRLFSNRFWYFPDGLQLIFGTGHNVYLADGYIHSDVGYVNDIWLLGIVGIIILYSLLITPIFISYKKIGKFKSLIVSLILAFLAANIKGYMLNYNAGMSITLLIILSISFFVRRRENNGVT